MNTESKAASERDGESRRRSKPWAAYILGYNSVMVRLWQKVFWNMPGPEWETWDSVPLYLEQLEEAFSSLSDEVVPEVGPKIQGPIDGMRKLHTAMIDFLLGRGLDGAFDFGSPLIPGVEEWRKLLFLMDQALRKDDRLRPFFSFGTALGRYQIHLDQRDVRDELPSLDEIQSYAQTLSLSVIEAIPEFMMLAVSATEGAGERQPTLLARIVGAGKHDACFAEDPSWDGFLMLKRMTRLNYLIQEKLLGLSDAVVEQLPNRAEDAGIEGVPRRMPFVPNPLQRRILAALAGRALKKQALADEVCSGEGTRLYRPGGIKELRDCGLVEHQPGTGYYRPNKPPPEMVDLP